MSINAGSVVEYYVKGSNIELALVLSVVSNGVRLLLLNGRETNVTLKKVAHFTSRNRLSISNREEIRQALDEINLKRQSIAEELDLVEIHGLLVEEESSLKLEEIASYLFDPDDEDSAAALLRRLLEDKVYFKHRNALFTPATSEEVEFALEQQEKRRQAELEEIELVEDLKTLLTQGKISELLKTNISWLENYVLEGSIGNMPKKLSNALEKANFNSVQKVLTALVRGGIFHEDENLDLLRNKIRIEFTREQLQLVDELCNKEMDESQRQDLTHLKAWAIDTQDTTDRDDAFSFNELDDGTTELWIHVADPTEYIQLGDPLDGEANLRGTSIYMPDMRIYMLPEKLCENLLSLDEGKRRLALSFKLVFDSEENLVDFTVVESVVKIEIATSYEEANEMLKTDTWLQRVLNFSKKLTEKRKNNGAIISPRQPELDIKVVDGEIKIGHSDREALTGGMVSEFMVWVNHGVALWFNKNSLPCLYRVQEVKAKELVFGEEFEPVEFWKAIKTFARTRVVNEIGRHSSLGFDGYTQVTSPLRRYSDLVLHRQIKRFLRANVAAYSLGELSGTMLMADMAVGLAEETMRNREQYFLLKYLKQQRDLLAKGQKPYELRGTIVDNSGQNDVIFYVDFIGAFKNCKRPNFDLVVGQPVRVRVNQIDLYEGLIRFELYPPMD